MRHTEHRAFEILLVEDNPADVRLTEEALKDGRLVCNLNVAADGIAGLGFLRREGGFAGSPRPDLILLDLNLPKKNGREVLAELKADPALATIPVVVLTSSAAEADIVAAYRLSAACFVTKPLDFDEFVKIIHAIEDFWFTVVRLPPVPPESTVPLAT